METSDRDPSDLYDDCRPEDFDPLPVRDADDRPVDRDDSEERER